MSTLRKWPVAVVVCSLAACCGIGCSSEGTEQTKTEQMRLTLDPRVKTFLGQGQQAVQQGAYEYALAMADSAEKYAPELADVYFLRGSIYAVMDQREPAQTAFEQVIALDPEYPGAHMMMGDNAFQRGKPREALQLYEAEEALSPTADLYVGMGRVYAELGVPDSARLAYEKAIALDSTNARTHMLYAMLAEETGDLEAALAHARKALALQPDHANYQFLVGAQLFRSGRLEESVGYLEQAVAASPLHYPAQYNLGQVLTRLGRTEEADRYLAQADSTQQLLQQITNAEQAATRSPDAVENWIRLGDLYATAGTYDRAYRAYNVAATLQPANLSVQHRLAQAILAGGNPQEAARRLQAILDADEGRADVWIDLGRAQAGAGRCSAARRAWETALRHRPGDAAAEAYLARPCREAMQ